LKPPETHQFALGAKVTGFTSSLLGSQTHKVLAQSKVTVTVHR